MWEILKRVLNNKIFIFVLGILLSSSVAVIAYSLSSSEISFVPDDNSWEVNNVEDAINSLYDNNKNDEFTFTWCCSNGGKTALTVIRTLPYVTFVDSSGSSNYNLSFSYFDNTNAGDIILNNKYDTEAISDRKAVLTCDTSSHKCIDVVFSNK